MDPAPAAEGNRQNTLDLEAELGNDSTQAAFAAQVRDALTHLLDSVHLQSHPLGTALISEAVDDPRVRAQLLRELILQAIADLRPAETAGATDAASRPHAILTRKYVQGFTNEDIQDELAIGRRQFFREQRRAVDALTDLLWQRRVDAEGGTGRQTLAEELEELGLQPRPFALGGALAQALEAARPLADEKGVVISVRPSTATEVFCDEDITRQLLVGTISAVIRMHPSSYIEIQLRSQRRWVALTMRTDRPPTPAPPAEAGLDVPAGLAARLGGRLRRDADTGQLHLYLPSAHREHVVVVDDNPKTLRLFRRYLEPYRFRVSEIQESTAAFDTIARLAPDAVILDIMMRSVDGWKVLQTLKADPATRHIPVIICSVLAEEDLARTVGADAYLRKPVTQSALIAALTRLLG